MKGIRLLIVDDEQPAREKIFSYLKNEEGIESIWEAGNGVEAVKIIQENNPNLVLLDIQMPGLNGFEVIEAVGVKNMPVVVFVTAFDQYAIDAFEVHAVDYLLKPFDQGRFKKSFDRAVEQILLKNDNAVVFKELLEQVYPPKKYLERIIVNTGSRYSIVKTNEIMYLTSEEKYINVHTANDDYLIRDTISNMELRLDPDKFARIHRSHIVNIEYIKEIQPWSHGDYMVLLKNGIKLNLSRRFRDRIFGKV